MCNPIKDSINAFKGLTGGRRGSAPKPPAPTPPPVTSTSKEVQAAGRRVKRRPRTQSIFAGEQDRQTLG